MIDLIDEQKIGTKIAERAIDRALEFATDVIRKRIAAHKNRSPAAFSEYIDKKRRYCRKIRNTIYDSDSVDLNEIYVNANFAIKNLDQNNLKRRTDFKKGEIVSDNELFPDLYSESETEYSRKYRAIIVRGAAGTGKSIFMRHIFELISTNEVGFIPIFLELRSINISPHTDIIENIIEEVKIYDTSVNKHQIMDGLLAGMFILIFDVLDEIKTNLQKYFESQIVNLAKNMINVRL